MENNQTGIKPDIIKIRSRFDEILVKHIRRLMEIDSLTTSVSFNLATISCLLLLVERENEIKDFPDAPPERYTREKFLDDIVELGIEIDDGLMASVQALAKQGYVNIDSNNKYNAEISAFAIVSFIDNLFPGMPGMSFVAFVLQMMEEVISNRKDLDDAINSFDQILLAKGIALSKQQLRAEEKNVVEKYIGQVETGKDHTQIPVELKKAYKDELSKLRSASDTQKSKEGYIAISEKWKGKEKVKSIFQKGPTEEEIRAAEEKREAELAAQREAENSALEAEKKAAELALREAEIKAREAEIKAAEIAAKEAEIKAREEEIAAQKAEKEIQAEKDSQEAVDEPEVSENVEPMPEVESVQPEIEKKIEAFQESLAAPCPVCLNGKIFPHKTEKEQTYYSCSNESCGFISWDKPYNFECPVCKNTFLVEFIIDEQPGLKCPRSSCSFRQDHLGVPTSGQPSPETGEKPQKRKKFIRRRKKR